jgi:hypothetical protein
MEKDILMIESKTLLHHVVNVKTGYNFKMGKYPFWGMSSDYRLYIANFMNPGDVIWFCTETGNDTLKVIRMAEYTHYHDVINEPLFRLNIIEREKQNWDENVMNDIQIHYKNIYDTGKQNIFIKYSETDIFAYSNDYGGELYKHYGGFIYYGTTV